ncbi:Putative DNA repair helicase RadD [Pontiella desulfatans]|uniref:DNA repair helicase RadD n=1 Tax=Pontiella desulfatans TaxID=2750659 RepID=A0A6C2U5B8_PONDE|nr:DEAD/DEAH box helicase family protein [Pontiella desulfatans]VGO15029.1 Putative DNA repair helicase RadD [Pontiella desulfatans]
MNSNFTFLRGEWPEVTEAAAKAENAVHADPRAACFYARRAVELLVQWAFKHDPSLKLPYQDNLSALIHEPTFREVTGQAVFSKLTLIVRLGNQAVHSRKPIRQYDALTAVRELFHAGYWLAFTYARGDKPAPGLAFDQELLQREVPVPFQTAEQLKDLAKELHERDEKLSTLLADKEAMDAELKRLRAEVAEAKKEAAGQQDDHDYSEEETRDYFIDLLLRETGWSIDLPGRDTEFPVVGMPNNSGDGFVDYVLWGDDGKPLGLVEAKRTRRDARVGQQQAKLYADCLEAMYGQRPIIFYSNGYEHWMWDDVNYPPRPVQGFYKKAELELMIQRRTSMKPLGQATINEDIAGRYYQKRAIRRIAEAFEQDKDRKSLLVMATGAGKTRTVIAFADLLMRCNRAKRVLFLADRVALVNQAVNAFKQHLPDSSPVNLVTEKGQEGRVFVSTYPTMMGLIDESSDGQRRFGVGHFDLVVIDEAHRSVFEKYRAIFEYFDSLLVGLTATPKDEVDRNTYSLFDLEDGVPTDAYSLEEAVSDGFLVPPKAVSVPLKFQREGIRYDDLSEDEQEQWEELDWDAEDEIPDRVDAASINQWLFNKDTVDKVLAYLMTRGLKVAGGDRLGKTIVFAKNQAHADFIQERFDKNYPHLKGSFARTITFKTEYAQSLIDDFSGKEKNPHIAISVDMLDTGIDVPEVVNLVFFKLVRSKTKFWQMLGRGTRLCPGLFAPGEDKQEFYIFDFCQNLEYFSLNPDASDGSTGATLGERLFRSRLELIQELSCLEDVSTSGEIIMEDLAEYEGALVPVDLRRDLAVKLYAEVTAMNVDNFVVRLKRRLIEKYSKRENWGVLSDDDYAELANEVAGLPNELPAEGEEAKRFDLLILYLQLALLRSEPVFQRLQEQVMAIAGLLEEKDAIPMVRSQMPLIQEIQTAEWWQNVTVGMLERVRKHLRDLIKLIEKKQRKPIYSDFEDEMGDGEGVDLPGVNSSSNDFERFREKARVFLREHQDHLTIHKLRMNKSLTPSDLEELERMLAESGVGTTEDIELAKQEANGLGLFVRSLVGLDREAAKAVFGEFLVGTTYGANQIEFCNLIINHLTDHGVMDAACLYASPFTDLAPQGPEGLFTTAQIDDIVALLDQINEQAIA